jgi:hypothetical protein
MAKSNFFKDNQSLIFGGVLLYLINDVVLSPLLENLGLKKSKAEVNILAENSNVTSPWNPQFWASSPRGALILTDSAASNFVEQIWDSVGYFNDDFELVLSIFKQLKTQSQVSYLVKKFSDIKGKDLLTWLVGGNIFSYPADRFSAEEVQQLVNYVSNLKKY